MVALRVRVRCPSMATPILLLENCTLETSFADFKGKILDLLKQNKETGDDLTQATIMAGFPPRPLQLAADAAVGSALADNEIVTIRLGESSSGIANPQGSSWGHSRGEAPALTTRHGSKGKGKEKALRKGKHAAGKNLGGIHSLSGPVTPSSPVRKVRMPGDAGNVRGSEPGQVSPLFGSGGMGRGNTSSHRLSGPVAHTERRSEGQVVDGISNPSPGTKRRRGTRVQMKSEADVSERLLNAVSGGSGTANKFFRKAMRLAVDKQYDQSKADARVRAAMGGWFKSDGRAGQRRLGTGEPASLRVAFSKGPGTKSNFEEDVECIPQAQVAAVVRMVAADPESREMLKPHNMAGCSPRIFWSLVTHWGGNVPRALELAVPDQDWSFLHVRERHLSEKARQNVLMEEEERRQKTKKQKIESGNDMDSPAVEGRTGRKVDKGTGITEEDRGSMAGHQEEEEEQEPTGGAKSQAGSVSDTLRSLAARAAMARLTASQAVSVGDPPIATTAGEIEDRRQSALHSPSDGIGCAGAQHDVDTDLEGLSDLVGKENAAFLIAVGIRTPGQLADGDEEDLAQKLKNQTGAEDVASWVEQARAEELDAIMTELVGGDDMVEALEKARVSTPRDLVRLGAFPDVFVETI
ncbi:unnamed protein product, partial [Choristocarpus tenellus]